MKKIKRVPHIEILSSTFQIHFHFLLSFNSVLFIVYARILNIDFILLLYFSLNFFYYNVPSFVHKLLINFEMRILSYFHQINLNILCIRMELFYWLGSFILVLFFSTPQVMAPEKLKNCKSLSTSRPICTRNQSLLSDR